MFGRIFQDNFKLAAAERLRENYHKHFLVFSSISGQTQECQSGVEAQNKVVFQMDANA
jgi:hypothetical protein